jgi:hypothetical protein
MFSFKFNHILKKNFLSKFLNQIVNFLHEIIGEDVDKDVLQVMTYYDIHESKKSDIQKKTNRRRKEFT